jgi:hypothetical protein
MQLGHLANYQITETQLRLAQAASGSGKLLQGSTRVMSALVQLFLSHPLDAAAANALSEHMGMHLTSAVVFDQMWFRCKETLNQLRQQLLQALRQGQQLQQQQQQQQQQQRTAAEAAADPSSTCDVSVAVHSLTGQKRPHGDTAAGDDPTSTTDQPQHSHEGQQQQQSLNSGSNSLVPMVQLCTQMLCKHVTWAHEAVTAAWQREQQLVQQLQASMAECRQLQQQLHTQQQHTQVVQAQVQDRTAAEAEAQEFLGRLFAS